MNVNTLSGNFLTNWMAQRRDASLSGAPQLEAPTQASALTGPYHPLG